MKTAILAAICFAVSYGIVYQYLHRAPAEHAVVVAAVQSAPSAPHPGILGALSEVNRQLGR
jgi:hypothetical protein